MTRHHFDFGPCPDCGVRVRFVERNGRELLIQPDVAGNLALVMFAGRPDQVTRVAGHPASQRWLIHSCWSDHAEKVNP